MESTTRLLRLGSVSAILGLLAHVAESIHCFKADGKLQDAKFGWVPCNPDVSSSPCCSGVDYCLDNGLCLNGGVVNNVFTVQGCTDPSWGGDQCRKYCPELIDRNGYLTITLCDISNNACCGDNVSCCSSPDKLFQVPIFTNLKHPGNPPNSTGESLTVTMTVTQGLPAQTPSDASSAAATTNSDQQAMKVGLGVGIPLGILLLAAIGYLIWELRKKRQEMTGRGPGEGVDTVHKPYNGQTAAAHANHGVMPAMQQYMQSTAPQYEQYPQQQSYPSTELLNSSVIHQLPTELERGELDGGYHAAR